LPGGLFLSFGAILTTTTASQLFVRLRDGGGNARAVGAGVAVDPQTHEEPPVAAGRGGRAAPWRPGM
jgi:hypothetical protein